ncbi:MAG: hypothetical protein ABFS56_00765 [Pseudomonadota bacterium]
MLNTEHKLDSQQTNVKPSESEMALSKKELIVIILCLGLFFPALLGGTFTLVSYFSTLMASIGTTQLTATDSLQKKGVSTLSPDTLWRLRSCIAKVPRESQVALNH